MSQADSSRQALLAALAVRRYARLAVAVGVVVAVSVAVLFVLGFAGGRTRYPTWFYPSLAFVVFATVSILAAIVLVGRRVLRLAVHPAGIVRAAATGGLLAGTLWLLGALSLLLGPGRSWAAVLDLALPWAALLSPLGTWAGYTRYKRTTRAWPVAATAAIVAALAALLLANLAAFDLVSLLPDVGRGVDPGLYRLFGSAALLLVAGQAVLGTLAAAGERDGEPLALAVPAVLGLVAFALAPGRLGLAALAAGLGTSWAASGWRLRRVVDADVPAGPDPWD